MKYDVAVIGSGMSGLMAAAKAVSRKKSTLVITKGQGVLPLTSGCIDFWGYCLDDPAVPAASPYAAIVELAARRPEHPYAKVLDVLVESADFLKEILQTSGLILAGSIYENQKVLTALGTERVTALLPPSMVIKDPWQIRKVIAVGFKNYVDFFPSMFLDNLINTSLANTQKIPLTIDLGIKETIRSNHLSFLLESRDVLAEVIDKIALKLREQGINTLEYDNHVLLVFPAVLGRDPDGAVHKRLIQAFPVQIIEVPGLPPSIPGQRLYQAMTRYLRQQGTEFQFNSEVVNFTSEKGRIVSVQVRDSSGTTCWLEAVSFILAGGSFLGGGLVAEKDSLLEPVFKLPVHKPQNQGDEARFLSLKGQAFLYAGIEVDEQLRPLQGISNLYAAGGILAHTNYAAEKSGLGVALATGYKAGSLA